MNTPLLKLGRCIRDFRKQRDWTLEDLSEKTGIHWTYLAQIEKGSRNPSLKTLNRISRGLKMPLWKLFLAAEPLYGRPAAMDLVNEGFLKLNPRRKRKK